MVKKNRVHAPNWVVLAVILVVAAAAIIFLQQSTGKSISNSGNAIGLSVNQPNNCPAMDTCGLGYWWYVRAFGTTKEEASKNALEKCVLRSTEVIEEASSCMKKNQRTCMDYGDCGYQGTGPTIGPCNVVNCEPTAGEYSVTPQGLPNWTDLWYCMAAQRVDGSSTCTMI